MVSVNHDNNSTIPNPTFESQNDEETHMVPHSCYSSPVLQSKVVEESINSPVKNEKSKFNNVLRERWIRIQQYTHLVPLIVSMVIVVAILQIPTILYYTDPPLAEVALLDNIDLESCSVSLCIIYVITIYVCM